MRDDGRGRGREEVELPKLNFVLYCFSLCLRDVCVVWFFFWAQQSQLRVNPLAQSLASHYSCVSVSVWLFQSLLSNSQYKWCHFFGFDELFKLVFLLLAVVFAHSVLAVRTAHIHFLLFIAVISLPLSVSSQDSTGCFEQRAPMLR